MDGCVRWRKREDGGRAGRRHVTRWRNKRRMRKREG